MKKTTTKKTTKADLTRAREIADVLGVLSQFIPRVDGSSGISPLFSREFLLKDLIGLTQEEYDRNEDLLKKECGNIELACSCFHRRSPNGGHDVPEGGHYRQ